MNKGFFELGTLCAEYDVAPEQAMTDIQNTVDSWLKEGVIL